MQHEKAIYDFLRRASDDHPFVHNHSLINVIYGTKQRRYGRIPSAKHQELLERVIDQSNGVLNFFIPWASCKLPVAFQPALKFDIAEFIALTQLICLRRELLSFNITPKFTFRVDNLMDRWLFGWAGLDYAACLRQAALTLLPGAIVKAESSFATWQEFYTTATMLTPIFYDVIQGRRPAIELKEVGWSGNLPREQVDHYIRANRALLPECNAEWEAARYLAGTLARVKVGATAIPKDSITIAFNIPVPGAPALRPRVYFRTLPERFTNSHRPPWNARGYIKCIPPFVVPRLAAPREAIHNLIPHTTVFRGIPVETSYIHG